MRNLRIILLVSAVLVGIALYSYFSSVSTVQYTQVVLPIGIVVPYNLTAGEVYPEYSFRFGNLHGTNPSIFQVWSGSVNAPTTLSVIRGAIYHAFSIEIRVDQVQNDYIVVSVRHLAK